MGSSFKFPVSQDESFTLSSSSSERNSITDEDKQVITQLRAPVEQSVSNLMLSHFGHELHTQHQQFNMVFSELYKLASDTNTIMFTYLPLREIFL